MPTRPADPIGDRETRRPPMDLILRNLPAHHREILVATYFHRRTTTEAAPLLGLTPATAKARLYEAMRDLSVLVATTPDDRSETTWSSLTLRPRHARAAAG